jgi:hypothetical protein
VKVKDVMTTNVRTCFTSDSLATAAQLMWDHDCGCVPVLNEHGRVVGMLTDRDICMAAFFQGVPIGEIKVSAVMSRRLFDCTSDDDLSAAPLSHRRCGHHLRSSRIRFAAARGASLTTRRNIFALGSACRNYAVLFAENTMEWSRGPFVRRGRPWSRASLTLADGAARGITAGEQLDRLHILKCGGQNLTIAHATARPSTA